MIRVNQLLLLFGFSFMSTAAIAQWTDSGINVPTLANSTSPTVHSSDTLNQVYLLRKSDPSGTSYFDTLSRTTDEWGVLSNQIIAIDFVITDAGDFTFLDTNATNFTLTSYDAQLNLLWSTSPPMAPVNPYYIVKGSGIVKGAGDDYFVCYRDNVLNQTVVQKYDGSSWTNYGGVLSSSENFKELKVDNNGIPHFLYYIDDTQNSQTTHYIRAFDGTQWPIVASHMISATVPYGNTFTIDSNNDILLFHVYSDNATFEFLVDVERFSSGTYAYTNVATDQDVGFTEDMFGFMSITDRNNKPHMFYTSYDLGWTTVRHFSKDDQSNNWTAIDPNFGGSIAVSGHHIEPTVTIDELNCVHFAFGFTDDPFNPAIPDDVIVRKLCECTYLDSINTVTLDQNNILNSSITSYPLNYQWIDCSTNTPIAGATNSTFSPQQNGSYALIASSINSCADTSACVAVSTIGFNELLFTQFSVHPNPTTDQLTISTKSGENTAVHITITDLSGKVLIENASIGLGIPLSVAKLSSGNYFIQIEGNQSIVTVPFMKQ